MKCIGFGEYKGKCTNKAGTKWGPYWCERCNKLRLDHIDNSLKGLIVNLERDHELLQEALSPKEATNGHKS